MEDEATGVETLGSVETTVAHPVFLKLAGVMSPVDGAATGGAAGLAILMPAAFAIFRSSFSSRFLSFSLRLSISSWLPELAFCAACMPLNLALWWCA